MASAGVQGDGAREHMQVFVYDAVRTPRGKGRAGGGLSGVKPMDLVAGLVEALRRRLGVEAVDALEHFTLGCVTQTGAQGGNIALASRIRAGLPDTVPCLTVNAFCVSGLSAVADAARRVATGEVGLALAGGVESMSQVPFMGDVADYYADMGLARSQGWVPVGLAADLLAQRDGIDRGALDEAAQRSHARASRAWAEGRFDGRVVPVLNAGGQVSLARDENVRPGFDPAALAALEPVFARTGAAGFDDILAASVPGLDGVRHVHTLAHCPPVSDGAALVVVGSREAGERLGLTPVARIVALTETAGDHVLQLTAGFSALDKALARAGRRLDDLGAVEVMESFAVTPVKFERDRGPDMDRVNVNGGHLAMGHPMGASGAILVGALLDAMDTLGAADGVVAATGGVGVGAALVIERT